MKIRPLFWGGLSLTLFLCLGCVSDFAKALDNLFAEQGASRGSKPHQANLHAYAVGNPTQDPELSEQEKAVWLLNDLRVSQGLAPLHFNPHSPLQKAASLRAQEIAQSFSHTRPDGRDCSSVLAEFGLGFRHTGENIAYGTRLKAQGVFNLWRKSKGHYQNMVSDSFEEVGLASWQRGDLIFWVQIFLRP